MPLPSGMFSDIPLSRIERVGAISLLHRDLFSVSWVLGRFCNYKCSYCFPFANSSKPDHRPVKQLIETMDEIKRQARERGFNSYQFSFTGGEPFLHKGFLRLLKHYSGDTPNSNYQSVQVTTNLSPGMKYLAKFIESTRSLHVVNVTASFHSEFAEKEVFADKLRFLQENAVHVLVNIVMIPRKFDELNKTAIYFRKRKINVTLKPLIDERAEEIITDYTPDQLKKLQEEQIQQNYLQESDNGGSKKFMRPRPKTGWLDHFKKGVHKSFSMDLTDFEGKSHYMDQGERLNAFNFNRFKNWECSAGYRSLIIREPGGIVKRGHSCIDEPLGSIEKGFRLFPRIRPCKTSCCVCSADIKIPKRKNNSSLPLTAL